MDRGDWNRRYAGAELLWSAGPNRFLVAEAADLPPGRALDLAAGEGRNAIWLAERGWKVTAVDFADVALAKARRLAAGRGVAVTWVRADLLDYAPPAEAFDLVLVFYLQVPADQRRRILTQAAGGLAEGGTLLVVGHHSANLAEGVGGPRDSAVLFAAPDVVADVPGLVIEKAERVLRPVETDEGERQAIDALVRARRPGAG